jgi:hypothetical protein
MEVHHRLLCLAGFSGPITIIDVCSSNAADVTVMLLHGEKLRTGRHATVETQTSGKVTN